MNAKQLNKRIFEPRIGLLVIIGILLALIPSASAADVLYSVSVNDNLLRIIDPSTGATTSSVVIKLPPSFSGYQIQNVNGLATQPVTNTLFALLTIRDSTNTVQPGRELVTINPTTGDATDIGNTGDKFGGLTFASSGTLYGVTGDGAAVPITLFTIDTTTAVASAPIMTFADTGVIPDGEAIVYNTGNIYRASGNGVPNIDEIFEIVDLSGSPLTAVNIPLSGYDYAELLAFADKQISGNFLAASGDLLSNTKGELININPTSGVVTKIGQLDHRSKGLAFAPAPTSVIPEFPTIALPIASVIGLMFLFQIRKGK